MGPAAARLAMLRVLLTRHDRAAILLHGDPGCAKSQLLDLLAMDIVTGSVRSPEMHRPPLVPCAAASAIEMVNGQSVTVDLIRDWRRGSACGNLFSDWSVKRIDEIDKASPAALAELLTWLDYLPGRCVVLASTNHFATLKAISKGRVETRFKTFRVDNPSVEECVPWLMAQFPGLPELAAAAIARQCVPDGQFDGVNLRAGVEDAESFLAEVETSQLAAA